MSGYHNLDNEEILFLYLANERILAGYHKILELGGIEKTMILDDDNFISNFYQIDSSDLEKIKEEPHYLYCTKIKNKLEPIVELIKESLPDLYKKVDKAINYQE